MAYENIQNAKVFVFNYVWQIHGKQMEEKKNQTKTLIEKEKKNFEFKSWTITDNSATEIHLLF